MYITNATTEITELAENRKKFFLSSGYKGFLIFNLNTTQEG